MSDRIDELARLAYADPAGIWLMDIFESIGMDKVEGLRRYYLDAAFHALCHKISRLAAIAREAEARTAEWIDRCYQSEERALKAEAERDALRLRVDELSHMVDAGLQVSAEKVMQGER